MSGFIIISISSGILFVILDGVINANPLAQRLYQVYRPIAKTSIHPLAGIVIDLFLGSSWLQYSCFSTIVSQERPDLSKG